MESVWVVAIVFYVTLATVTVFTNGVFMFVILRNKNLHNATNWILFSLSVSDLLVGLIVTPLNLLNLLGTLYLKEWICILLNICIVCVPLVSLFHLLAVAFERYIGILHPFRHRTLVTCRRTAVIIVLSWILPVSIGGIPVVGWNRLEERKHLNASSRVCSFTDILPCSYTLFSNILMLAVFFVEAVLYCRVFTVALRHARKMTANRFRYNPRDIQTIRSELKVVIALCVTIGYFMVSYFPLAVMCILFCADIVADPAIWMVVLFLAFTNSTVNPLIYGMGNRRIRRAFLRTMSLSQVKSSNQNQSVSVNYYTSVNGNPLRISYE